MRLPWARKSATAAGSCAVLACSGRSTLLWSPQVSGATRARNSTCPWSMQPTLPSLTTKRTQKRSLLQHRGEYFPDTFVPLLFGPEDTRRQNIMVTIPGPRSNQQELVLNEVVEMPLKYAREVLGGKWDSDWAPGYALTVQTSQSLTIADPQKVWIIDDFLQWSNLAYLAVSVEFLHQLEWVVSLPPPLPPEEGSGQARGEPAEGSVQQLRKIIQRKLVAYKRQDAAKWLRLNFKVDHIFELKEAQSNRCAECNIELLWAYQPKDTPQFSVDRLDNTNGMLGHTRGNIRLTYLEEGELGAVLERQCHVAIQPRSSKHSPMLWP